MSFMHRNVVDFSRENIEVPARNRADFYRNEMEEKQKPRQSFAVEGFICNVCGFSSKSEQGMKSHVTKMHS